MYITYHKKTKLHMWKMSKMYVVFVGHGLYQHKVFHSGAKLLRLVWLNLSKWVLSCFVTAAFFTNLENGSFFWLLLLPLITLIFSTCFSHYLSSRSMVSGNQTVRCHTIRAQRAPSALLWLVFLLRPFLRKQVWSCLSASMRNFATSSWLFYWVASLCMTCSVSVKHSNMKRPF